MFGNDTNDQSDFDVIEMEEDNLDDFSAEDNIEAAPSSAATSTTSTTTVTTPISATPTNTPTKNKRKRTAGDSIMDAVNESSEKATIVSEKRLKVHERQVEMMIAQNQYEREWRQASQAKQDERDAVQRAHERRQVAMANLGLMISNKMITKEEYFIEFNKLNNED